MAGATGPTGAAGFARTQVSDAAYTVLTTDRTVAMIALTAARTLTLPASSAYPAGAMLTVVDESGACSATVPLTLAAAGSDTINGAASAVIATAYGYLALESNTSNKWTIVDAPAPVTSVAGRSGAIALAVADVSGAAPLASPAFAGTPTAPNAAAGTNSAQVATTSFVAASFVTYSYASANYATAASPTLTGTPAAPTAAQNDNSTRLATTAYADRAAGANVARTQVSDAAYTVLTTDRTVAMIALTAARTLTLPAASAYPRGATLTVVDESGACSTAATVTLAAAGGDTINGASTAALSAAYGYLALESNTSNKWTIIDAPATGASTVTLASLGAAAQDDLRQVLIAVAKLTGSVLGLVAGLADDFRDQSGVDAANSVNAIYDSTNRLYSNVGTESAQSLPAMTSNSAPSGTTSASSVYSSSYDAWMAFDQSSAALWSAGSGSLPQWIQRQLAAAATMGAYAVTARSDSTANNPSGWTLLGSNDGSNWTTLDTQSGQSFTAGQTIAYTIPSANRASFTYHRLNITAGAGVVSLADLAFFKQSSASGSLDLRSVASAASAVPGRGSIYVLVKPLGGATITPNTNLIASLSRNGGATYTAVTLVSAGTLSSGFAAYEANGVDLTGQPSGQSMKWRVQSAGSLGIQVQAVVEQWG